MTDPFIVFRVSWLTQTPGEEERRDEIVDQFYQITKFLQDNRLLVRVLMNSREDLTDEFTLSSADLTEDGLEVMKVAYHKWLTKIDNGMSPENITLLSKALEKVRGA